MNEYIVWMLDNPILAILLLMVEYAVIMTLSVQTRFRPIAKLAAIGFIPQNALLNIFVLTPLFADPPQEWLSTARFKRYKKLYALPVNRSGKLDDWRYFFAFQMCRYLNIFDEGHC